MNGTPSTVAIHNLEPPRFLFFLFFLAILEETTEDQQWKSCKEAWQVARTLLKRGCKGGA